MLFEWTCIEPQPGEVDGDFLAEVQAYVVEGLVLVPLAPPGPVLVEDLPGVELARRRSWAGVLVGAVVKREGGVVGALVQQPVNAHLSLFLLAERHGGQNLVNHPGSLGTGEKRVGVFGSQKPRGAHSQKFQWMLILRIVVRPPTYETLRLSLM